MYNEDKVHKWMDPFTAKQELIETLVKGLDRALTHQEIKILHWICDSDLEKSGVITDLIKELVQK